jgi:tRNA G10  N-methylase Trm11
MERFLNQRLWASLNRQRDSHSWEAPTMQLADYVEGLLQDPHGLTLREGDELSRVEVNRRTLFAVVLRQVQGLLSPRRLATVEVGTDDRLVQTMVRLARVQSEWTLADPFCGIGTILWELEQRARTEQSRLHVHGVDINQDTARLSAALAALSDAGTSVRAGDAFNWLLGKSMDCIITEPPINVLLSKPRDYWAGSTRHWEPLVIARCLDALRPGGRLVIHTARGWLWHQRDERFRLELANRARITALLGLPDGLFTSTSIPSALVVVEKSPPTDTLIADLRDDWYEQLSPGGACWQRYVELVEQG